MVGEFVFLSQAGKMVSPDADAVPMQTIICARPASTPGIQQHRQYGYGKTMSGSIGQGMSISQQPSLDEHRCEVSQHNGTMCVAW